MRDYVGIFFWKINWEGLIGMNYLFIYRNGEIGCVRKVYIILFKLEVNRDILFLIFIGKLLNVREVLSI